MWGWLVGAAFGADPVVWQAREPVPPSSPIEPFTVAPLVVRVDDKLVGVTGEDLRVYMIEQIRALGGWPVFGIENPLFGQDRSGDARFVVGGEIQDVYPAKLKTDGTALDLRWQVLDRRTERVVYEVVTRGWIAGSVENQADELLMVAVKNLLARPGFSAALAVGGSVADTPAGEPLTVARCTSEPAELPAAFDRVLPAAVAIRTNGGSGSGVMVSADGFVLTAAHVVDGQSEVAVALHHGPQLAAEVVRIDAALDLAVLKVAGSGFACVSPAATPSRVGQPAFLVGAPLGSEENIVSSGVVSALRTMDGTEMIQTDASASPGNSGGPLLDQHGALLGILSSKVVGAAVEGMAFAVPMSAVSGPLGLSFGDASDAVTPVVGAATAPLTVDEPDPAVLDRDGRICFYWKGGAGPAQEFVVEGMKAQVGPRQYSCLDVPVGDLRIEKNGPKLTVSVGPYAPAYMQLVGRTGLTRTDKTRFDVAVSRKGLVEVGKGKDEPVP